MVLRVFMVALVLGSEMWKVIIIIHAFIFARKIKEGQIIKSGNLRIRGDSEMILETADALNLAVLNTWFKKERRSFTYENDECRTVFDYILSRKSEKKMIRDVKVVKVE